jgi:hypothetical protein
MSLKIPVTPPGVDLVAQRLNHYTIPGPIKSYVQKIKKEYRYAHEPSVPSSPVIG